MIKIGQTVRLKKTSCVYIVHRLYIADEGVLNNGVPMDEEWAELRTQDGKPAFWKVRQLEPLEQ